MCPEDTRPLTFESMLTDPLIRLMMVADGVSVPDLLAVMQVAQQAVATRERRALVRAMNAVAAQAAS